MTAWSEVLGAVPSGVAEALTTIGLTGLISKLRAIRGDDELVRSLESVRRGDDVDVDRLVEALTAASDAGHFVVGVASVSNGQQIIGNPGVVVQTVMPPNPPRPGGD